MGSIPFISRDNLSRKPSGALDLVFGLFWKVEMWSLRSVRWEAREELVGWMQGRETGGGWQGPSTLRVWCFSTERTKRTIFKWLFSSPPPEMISDHQCFFSSHLCWSLRTDQATYTCQHLQEQEHVLGSAHSGQPLCLRPTLLVALAIPVAALLSTTHTFSSMPSEMASLLSSVRLQWWRPSLGSKVSFPGAAWLAPPQLCVWPSLVSHLF